VYDSEDAPADSAPALGADAAADAVEAEAEYPAEAVDGPTVTVLESVLVSVPTIEKLELGAAPPDTLETNELDGPMVMVLGCKKVRVPTTAGMVEPKATPTVEEPGVALTPELETMPDAAVVMVPEYTTVELTDATEPEFELGADGPDVTAAELEGEVDSEPDTAEAVVDGDEPVAGATEVLAEASETE